MLLGGPNLTMLLGGYIQTMLASGTIENAPGKGLLKLCSLESLFSQLVQTI
jgi:hypothetical protein